ncbi:MAG: class I SAM-dependent methyltransferase [Calditrichaceae bacterium]
MSKSKDFAINYDSQVREYDSYGHDVLFGMSFEFVQANEKLLDIGIGTGLASIKFYHLGLKVFGLDSSQEMLDACQSKSFTESLNLYDMKSDRIPYEDNYFNHVICCGALHFIGDLKDPFNEIKRVMKPEGIFSFTIAPQNSEVNFAKENTAWGVPIFKHSVTYIMKLLEENGFELLKEQRLLIKGADKLNYDMLFSVLVAKYQ